MKHSKKILATILVLSSIAISCQNEDVQKSISMIEQDGLSLKESADDGLIPILSITAGEKVGPIFNKTCRGQKGICVLIFGGTFLSDPLSYIPEYPETYASLTMKNDTTLNLTIHYAYATDSLYINSINDINRGFVTIYDSICISDPLTINNMALPNPIIIQAGEYTIDTYDTINQSMTIPIPYSFAVSDNSYID